MKNGTGGESIYGAKFADESFKIKHTKAGVLPYDCNIGSTSSHGCTFSFVASVDGQCWPKH